MTAWTDAADATVAADVGHRPAAPPPPGSFLQPGEVFGPWRLLDHVADGGFGSVWRAAAVEPVRTDSRTVRVGENAAIKFFAATTTERRQAIEREVALARRLGGQWTPEYFGADLDAIPQWAAFELITDATLRDLVASTGPLTGQSLEVFAEDLWDAISFFRRHGIAHRDLTPVNIHVHARTAKPRVIDWGNAGEMRSSPATAQLPRSSGYAAPEQVEGRETGPAADLWSWAAVVCFAATGHPPLPVQGYHEAIVTCDRPLDLDGLPDALVPALDAALRWDPDDRDPERIAACLPGGQTSQALDAARAREVDLDEAVTELERRIRLRDEHVDELRAQIDQHRRDRTAAVAATARLAQTERARDEAAREVTALRSRVAELETALGRAQAAADDGSARDAELRRLRLAAGRQDLSQRYLRWRTRHLQRQLDRSRRRRGRVATSAPLVGAVATTLVVAALALGRATWESRLLPLGFAVPALAGIALAARCTARSDRMVDHARAVALGLAILAPFLSPMAWSAGAVPIPSLAEWLIQAPFVTPPPPDAIGVGHGARHVDVDPGDCTTPLPPASHWQVVIVPCPVSAPAG